jgi:YVTN family beta-propeller protein
LENVKGRIDHLAISPNADRLFIAALGNNTVEVIDLKSNQRLKTINDLREPQGIAVIGDSGKFAVASGQDGMCRIFDASFQLLAAIPSLDDADNVRFDPRANRLYVGYGSGALAVIDPDQGKVISTFKLQGHPESFQLDPQSPRIFVNVPTAAHVAVVDRETGNTIATWGIAGAAANFPMAIDSIHQRLFIACRKPARLIAFDMKSGKPVASTDCVGDADDLFYDSANHRIYIAGGEGFLDVFDQADPDRYLRLQHISTAPGARTALFSQQLARLFLAVPHRGEQSAEVRIHDVAK